MITFQCVQCKKKEANPNLDGCNTSKCDSQEFIATYD